jgi:hypothetical protein
MATRWILLVTIFSLLGCPSGSPSGATPPSSASANASASTAPAPQIAPKEDAGALEDAAAKANPGEPQGKILCFGDSITQADWPGKIAPEERWVTQLGK